MNILKCALVLGSLNVFANAAAAQAKQIYVLPTLGGTQSMARDINEAGVICGDSANAQGESHAALWMNGEVIDLGIFPGGFYSSARAISNRGQVIGTSQLKTPEGELLSRPFLWDQGTIYQLPALPGADNASGDDINDNEVIVGTSGGLAVVWENRQPRSLGTLGGKYSYASAISSRNWIVGSSMTADYTWHAFLYRDGQMIDLGTLGGHSSYANDVNDRGQITGTIEMSDGRSRAFIWEDGTMRDVGVAHFGDAGQNGIQAVSSSGLAVGSGRFTPGLESAAIWSADGSVYDLGGLPGAVRSQAFGINNKGVVVGFSATDAEFQAVIWK